MLDFVLSNSTWGNGELRVKFRQPFELIALGTTELKQKKAAGVGSDDLYQFEYTPEDSNALGNSLAKQSKSSLVGQLVGQTALQDDSQTDELLELWYAIEPEKRSHVLEILQLVCSKH